MSLQPQQFPSHGFNPFAAMANRIGKTRTKGLVSNQEHEGVQLQHAIVTTAVQHHFAMKAAEKQNQWAEQSAAAAHGREQERLKTGASLMEGGKPFTAKVGTSEFSGVRKTPKPRVAKTPEGKTFKPVVRGAKGQFARKQG